MGRAADGPTSPSIGGRDRWHDGRAAARPSASGSERPSLPTTRPPQPRSRAHARIGAHQAGTSVQRQEVVNHPRHPADTGNSRLTTPSQVDAFGREVDAHTRDRPSSRCQKTHELQAKPSVGLEPTTPSLPWKGERFTGVHGRSRPATESLQIAINRSVRPWWSKYDRCGSSGRGVDALPLAVRVQNLHGSRGPSPG
jgi:hypothetical protein